MGQKLPLKNWSIHFQTHPNLTQLVCSIPVDHQRYSIQSRFYLLNPYLVVVKSHGNAGHCFTFGLRLVFELGPQLTGFFDHWAIVAPDKHVPADVLETHARVTQHGERGPQLNGSESRPGTLGTLNLEVSECLFPRYGNFTGFDPSLLWHSVCGCPRLAVVCHLQIWWATINIFVVQESHMVLACFLHDGLWD